MIMKRYYIFFLLVFLTLLSTFASCGVLEELGIDVKLTAAVMDLEPGEGISKGTAMSLSDYLRIQLVNTNDFVVVTRENMEQVLKEQQFQLSNCTSQECIVQVGKLLGARKMFAGSIGKVGTTYLITLRIIDVESGKIEKAETEKCTKCEEDALIKSIKNIVDKIKIIEPDFANIKDEQLVDYSRVFHEAAIDSCTKAIEKNPKNAAEYYGKRAFAYFMLGRYQDAISDYSKLIELNPKNFEYYVRRTWPYNAVGKHRESIAEKIKEFPHLADKFDETTDTRNKINEESSFFIRNLESAQGDQRDVIILSVGYGPDQNGNVFNRFGPINSRGGYRRLNVAVTRARDKIICVSSMKFYQMSPSEGTRGAILLQKYLEYAEKGRGVLEASKIIQQNNKEPDSDFEVSVQKELQQVGYIIHQQVGAAGFFIDLAVVNPDNENEYVLGIECDGAACHSSKSARIRDRLRQEVLERLGWKFYRIWSQHWIMHRQEVLDDIVKYINKMQ